MSPTEVGVYLRLVPAVDDAIAGLQAMRAAAEDARVAVLAFAGRLRSAVPTRVARRAERRRVTRTIRQATRDRLAERREERAYLRSWQHFQHHPDTAATERAARIATLRQRLHTPTPRSTL